MMRCDFIVPTSCALGVANTFMFAHQPSVSINDRGDGSEIELKEHDIVIMRIFFSERGEQVYIQYENQWVPVGMSPLFLAKNLKMFAPFNRHLEGNPHSL